MGREEEEEEYDEEVLLQQLVLVDCVCYGDIFCGQDYGYKAVVETKKDRTTF